MHTVKFALSFRGYVIQIQIQILYGSNTYMRGGQGVGLSPSPPALASLLPSWSGGGVMESKQAHSENCGPPLGNKFDLVVGQR